MTIILPEGLKELLAPRLKNNATGFQRAHVTGRATWNDDIKWLSKLGFGPDSDFNLTPLPEGQRGSATLGVAAHLGNNVDAFDDLFYDFDPDDPTVAENSGKFLNVLENQYDASIREAKSLGGTQAEIDERITDINRSYRIRVMNFTDFIKTAFLYQDQLDELGYNDLKSLGLNSADPRFADAAAARAYLQQADVQRMFDYDFIVDHPYFEDIETLRGNAEINIDRALIETHSALARAFYPDGEILWTDADRANILAREMVMGGITDAQIRRGDRPLSVANDNQEDSSLWSAA